MKVLYFNGFFKLPDDFKGKFPDALREFAKYRETGGVDNPNRMVKAGATPIPYAELWTEFLNHVETGDCVLGYSFVGETTPDGSAEYDDFGELKQ